MFAAASLRLCVSAPLRFRAKGTLLHALFLFAICSALSGCTSAPPLEDWERFKITARRGTTPDKHECIVVVECKNAPPPPIGRILVVSEPQLVEGDVVLEIKGWRGPKEAGEKRERIAEAVVGLRTPSARFKFVLLDRGHRDEYTVVMPPTGEPTIEPAAGDFSERG